MSQDLLNELVTEIESDYVKLGFDLGWRFLTAPAHTLSPTTDVCLVTLNPGGSEDDLVNPRSSNETGSAYVVEAWGTDPPGRSKLQLQVQALFEIAEIDHESVLSGHLIPFRSPSWEALPLKRESLELGKRLWSRVLSYVQPSLVIAIGKSQLRQPLLEILGEPQESREVPVNWGSIKAGIDRFADCTLVSLPHLSRFGIATRAQSRTALRELFESLK